MSPRCIALKPFSLALVLPVLAACTTPTTQGAKTPIGPTPPASVTSPNGNTYVKLGAATAGANALTGLGLLTTVTATGPLLTTQTAVSGSLDNSAGQITVTDKNGTFTGTNTAAAPNIYTDTGNQVLKVDPYNFASTYDFVRPYTRVYTTPNGTTTAQGVIGVATNTADIPTTGTATYVGTAQGVVYDVSGRYDINQARATLTATFGGATPSANVTIDQFNDVSYYGTPAAAPVSKIVESNYAISGSKIVVGPTTIFTVYNNAGAVMDLVGTVYGLNYSEAQFYGYDTVNNIPDEVGGVLAAEGTTGGYFLGYMAD